MTSAEARAAALRDAASILGTVEYDGSGGMAPAFECNKFLSDEDKKKIRREFSLVISSLYKRIDRAEKQIEREFRRTQ